MATVNGPTIAVSRNAGGTGAESLNDRIRMQPERRRNREAERLAASARLIVSPGLRREAASVTTRERLAGSLVRISASAVGLAASGTPARSAAPRMNRSARSRSEGGIVSPSVLAVLRLMTSSNFVGGWNGSSAGLAPLRIRRCS